MMWSNFLAAIPDDIIGEHGKFGLDIRKKEAGGEVSPSVEISCITETRPGCQDLIGSSSVARERLDQRLPAVPFINVLMWV